MAAQVFDLSDGGDLALAGAGWSVRQRTLHGGLSDGVRAIDIDNGALTFTVLPTRGMGLWRGRFRNLDLGWQAPVRGPVHPKFVELSARGGLGWLTGFDEWLCRCGLAWNGPPGDDNGFPLTLHGRIANQPAHRVELSVDSEAKSIQLSGDVEEGGLFYPRLHLTTAITTEFGSNSLSVRDEVVNLSSRPAELQLLYHVNFGPPLLEPGGRVHVAVDEIAPNTAWAAAGIESWDRYRPPTSGFEEQVYLMRPRPGPDGWCAALLHDAAAARGALVRWTAATLPYFNLWKNTAALEDGYVTGLEPATGFPRFRAAERAAGRVPVIAPSERFSATLSLSALATADEVARAATDVRQIQARGPAVVHREPPP